MYNLSFLWPKLIMAANEFCAGENGPITSTVSDAAPYANTALGCVPMDFGGFVQWILPRLFGFAGGIAFLLMVYGFVLWSTSGGDPKKVGGAQETITSAVKGLILCIFGLFVIRLIAVDILRIPGISK